MAEDPPEIPEGAAVLPEIPAELDVQPLLLAVLHAAVFLAGSDDKIVDPAAAAEALEQLAAYVQRLHGPELRRAQADLECLVSYARRSKWPKQEVQFFKTFLTDFGVGEEDE